MRKILVTGATGLVGSRFIELHVNKSELLTPDVSEMDITSSKSVKNYLTSNKPDVVINFAAYTNVTEAENQRDDKTGICWKINVEAVGNILDCINTNTHFIQISTDQVFPGSNEYPGPYEETNIPEIDSNKLVWYGFTKAEAEQEIIKKLKDKATIVRIIYPFRSKFDKKLDYLRKPLGLFDQGKLYPMFSDQQISVVFIDDACAAIEKIINLNKRGIFHASSRDTSTPFELITYMLEKTRGVKNAVKVSSLDEFLKTVDNPVRYPKFGGLKVAKTEKDLDIKFGSWKEMIDDFASGLQER